MIEYDITIVTPTRKLEQKGYAIYCDSEMYGTIEYETDDKGQTLGVIPYNTRLCSCNDRNLFEIRVSVDKKKVSIFSFM